MAYTPRGKIVPFIEAMRADPLRVWTIREIAQVMGLHSNKVGGSLIYALRHRVVFRGKRRGETVFRGVPFEVGGMAPPEPVEKLARRGKDNEPWTTDMDDARVPKVVPGWRPPTMVPPRAGSAR